MPGPVPILQAGQLLNDLAEGIPSAYADFGQSEFAPEVRIRHGNFNEPWDCPNTAWIVNRGLQPANVIGAEAGRGCAIIAEALITIEIARCWPTPDDNGNISPVDEETAAQDLARDATVLWWGLGGRYQDGTLFPSYPGLDCELITLGPLQPIAPQGGLAGWSWQLRAIVGMTRVQLET